MYLYMSLAYICTHMCVRAHCAVFIVCDYSLADLHIARISGAHLNSSSYAINFRISDILLYRNARALKCAF
jgi:hypothetical protein